MKILLTGAEGYIGKHIYKSFSTKHKITAIGRKDVDLSDSSQVDSWFSGKSFDVVIHSAAIGGSRLVPDTSFVTSQNLNMYFNLLSHKNKFKKCITFGSGAEIFMPNSFYGLSKKAISQSIQNTDNFFNLRIFAVFNENELDTRFIKSNIIRYKRNEDIEIHCNKIMDFFYMEDLMTLVDYYLTEKNPPKEINCSYETKKSLIEIANIINKSKKHKVNINLKDSNNLEFYCGTSTKLPLKYIGLEKGIEKTFNLIN
jgi:UDP-glucose 4-epimerase